MTFSCFRFEIVNINKDGLKKTVFIDLFATLRLKGHEKLKFQVLFFFLREGWQRSSFFYAWFSSQREKTKRKKKAGVNSLTSSRLFRRDEGTP
jgi:hypothetical protein